MSTETKVLKRCSKCGEMKAQEEFHKSKQDRFSVKCWCKECMSIYAKQWRKKHPEYTKEHRHKKENPETHRKRMMYYNRMCRAELKDSYIRQLCRFRGIPVTPIAIELERELIRVRRFLCEFKKWRKDHESDHPVVEGKQF